MVQAGLNFSVVIAQGGSAYAWGSNDYGQLGVSDYSARYEPTRVCFPEGECISQIAVNELHSVLLRMRVKPMRPNTNHFGLSEDKSWVLLRIM